MTAHKPTPILNVSSLAGSFTRTATSSGSAWRPAEAQIVVPSGITPPFGTITIPSNPTTVLENGTIDDTGCKLGRGSYADRWVLELNVNSNLDILLSSTDFDARIIIRDASDHPFTAQDEGGPGNDARITQFFLAGTYYLFATSQPANQQGNYDWTINASAP